MPVPVLLPASLITLALVFYSTGVWAEKLSGDLKNWHVAAFWTGLAFDFCGTYAMHLIASRPFRLTDGHTLTGQIALWLMFIHALWAWRVSRRGSDQARRGFHRYSLAVWCIWLIPYIGGMILGMKR